MLRDWAGPYIGAPYRDLGADPEGWDCWGLVLWCGRTHLGWSIPDFPSAAEWAKASRDLPARGALVAEGLRYWRRLDIPEGGRPRQYAVALMARNRSAGRWHCGITDGRDLLHVQGPSGTVREPLYAHGQPRVRGFYVPGGDA